MKTQVAIIGGGPSGLLLARLLRLQGIESLVLERKDRQYVEARIRAGVLEPGTVDVLREAGVSERLERECLYHEGLSLAFSGQQHRIDLHALTGGRKVTIYGQTELTIDLYRALLDEDDAAIVFNTGDVKLSGFIDGRPRVTYQDEQGHHALECEFIAACDGSHGVSRSFVPADRLQVFEKVYPFGWLGLLADTPPVDEELVYASHERGFALCSQRSLQRSRYYLQCDINDRLDDWTAGRFWDELRRRIPADKATCLVTGPALEMSIAPLRSVVTEPMRFGKLYLVGDAAHILPPTGAKGLNLAVSDVHYLSRALCSYYLEKRTALLDRYSETALRRVWAGVRFSWWFTSVMHRFSEDTMDRRLQHAELEYLAGSRSGQAMFAENYVGLPFEDFS